MQDIQLFYNLQDLRQRRDRLEQHLYDVVNSSMNYNNNIMIIRYINDIDQELTVIKEQIDLLQRNIIDSFIISVTPRPVRRLDRIDE